MALRCLGLMQRLIALTGLDMSDHLMKPHSAFSCMQMAMAGMALATLPVATSAQISTGAVGREIVQPLPSPEIERLNDALRRLARDSQDVSALTDAGDAALELGDLDAAMGFFGRAQEMSQANARAKMGMAAVFLRSGRPVDALRLFAEAEQAGASSDRVAADRGLAYDLVGNNAEAQNSYRAALAGGRNDETTRRLALSHAIAGNRQVFEATLLPLLQKRDYAAYRARAFGLAILGDEKEAASIVSASMPTDLASRIAPYLAYMPRLTKAQQAAAANLGVFPKAAEIGRDDPQIAQYATSAATAARRADSRLAPAGQPLDQGGGRRRSSSAPSSRLASVAQQQANAVQNFDLAQTSQPAKTAPPTQPSVADAFGNLGAAQPARPQASAGAVDIARITPPREVREEKPAKPAPPAHPSRIWVQVAAGRDRSALKFDWRRLERKAPDLLSKYKPHVVAVGQGHRLLAGPLSSDDAARDLINALKAQGVDSLRYTSPEGEEVNQIQ